LHPITIILFLHNVNAVDQENKTEYLFKCSRTPCAKHQSTLLTQAWEVPLWTHHWCVRA